MAQKFREMIKIRKIINFRGKNFVTAAKFREAPPICVPRAHFLTPSSDGGLLFLKQLAMALRSFEVQSCIRGYHIYMTVWTPYIGETLPCSQENTNGHDPFAVKVSQLTGEDETIVDFLK